MSDVVVEDAPLMLKGEEYIKFMRKMLCPPEMVDEEGLLREEYFQPRKDVSDGVVWTEDSVEKLQIGLLTFGVGSWSEIRQTLLTHWDEVAIRLKTSMLLGVQDLTPYLGQKLSKENINEIHAENEKIAKDKGIWYAGIGVNEQTGFVKTKSGAERSSSVTC